MSESASFFEDPEKISYPDADKMVDRYITEMASQRSTTTSVDVIRWADVENNSHNRKRVYDALNRVCEETESNWAGRTVFEIRGDERA